MFGQRSTRWRLLAVVVVLVVTAGCMGFGDDPATPASSTTPTVSTPSVDTGVLGGTTTTTATATDGLPYRLTVSNEMHRNITVSATYAANGTTAVSDVYAAQTNVSLGHTLQSDVAYAVTINSGDHTLWNETIQAGEGYRLVITEWGSVSVEDHVRAD